MPLVGEKVLSEWNEGQGVGAAGNAIEQKMRIEFKKRQWSIGKKDKDGK